MQLGASVADANGRTLGERCGLPPTWLSTTACDWLEYARCRLIGQETRDVRPPLILWSVREPTSNWGSFSFFCVTTQATERITRGPEGPHKGVGLTNFTLEMQALPTSKHLTLDNFQADLSPLNYGLHAFWYKTLGSLDTWCEAVCTTLLKRVCQKKEKYKIAFFTRWISEVCNSEKTISITLLRINAGNIRTDTLYNITMSSYTACTHAEVISGCHANKKNMQQFARFHVNFLLHAVH